MGASRSFLARRRAAAEPPGNNGTRNAFGRKERVVPDGEARPEQLSFEYPSEPPGPAAVPC